MSPFLCETFILRTFMVNISIHMWIKEAQRTPGYNCSAYKYLVSAAQTTSCARYFGYKW